MSLAQLQCRDRSPCPLGWKRNSSSLSPALLLQAWPEAQPLLCHLGAVRNPTLVQPWPWIQNLHFRKIPRCFQSTWSPEFGVQEALTGTWISTGSHRPCPESLGSKWRRTPMVSVLSGEPDSALSHFILQMKCSISFKQCSMGSTPILSSSSSYR